MTMTKRTMGPRSGMTVVELAIAATVFAVLLGGVMRSMQSASGLMESTSAVLEIDRKARKLGQELRTTLENASAGTVDPIFPLPGPGDPTPYQTDVRFNEIVDWSGGAVVLGPEQRLFLRMETTELDNGRDDDGDGRVDGDGRQRREGEVRQRTGGAHPGRPARVALRPGDADGHGREGDHPAAALKHVGEQRHGDHPDGVPRHVRDRVQRDLCLGRVVAAALGDEGVRRLMKGHAEERGDVPDGERSEDLGVELQVHGALSRCFEVKAV